MRETIINAWPWLCLTALAVDVAATLWDRRQQRRRDDAAWRKHNAPFRGTGNLSGFVRKHPDADGR